MDDIENGMVLDNDDFETFGQEDYDYYWQDDFRKDNEIQQKMSEEK